MEILYEEVSDGETIKRVAPVLGKPDIEYLNETVEKIKKSLKDEWDGRLCGDRAQIFFWGIIGKIEELCEDTTEFLAKSIEEWQDEIKEVPNDYSIISNMDDGLTFYFYAGIRREIKNSHIPPKNRKAVKKIKRERDPSFALKTLYLVEVQIGTRDYKTGKNDVCLVTFGFKNNDGSYTKYLVSNTD